MPALSLAAAVLFLAATAVYDFTTLSAAVPRWLAVYLWAVLGSVVFLCVLWRKGWRGSDQIDALALALLAWMALSLAWSGDWRQGVYELTNAAALCAVFLWVRRYPQWIPEFATVSVIVALGLHYLYPHDWGGHGNRNFQTEAIVLALCLGCETRRKWALALWLIVAGVAIGYLLIGNPSKIEFLVLLFLGLWLYGRRKLRIIRARKGGTVVELGHGMAGVTVVRPWAGRLRCGIRAP